MTAVPIPAVAVRELVYDANGQVVKAPTDQRRRRRRSVEPVASAAELKPGQTRKEAEGVFVVRDGKRVEFVPIKMGIAGDKYFEVLDGPEAGRRGHHRALQLGPRHGRRRPGQGRQPREQAEQA